MTRTYVRDQKAICPLCGREVRIRNNGTMNKHGYIHARIGLPTRSNPCPGSGKLPSQVKRPK